MQTPDAPATPFEVDEDEIVEADEARAADARADAKFAEALRNNQRGDNYTILTVAFATVLFFAALSSRLRSPRAQWALLGLGLAGFLVAAALLVAFPRLV